MIVGADGSDDDAVLGRSENLYGNYRLKRVYYSAFSPIPDASSRLPLAKPPLMREHRLYQADWLMRFYGFARPEIVSGGEAGMLDLAIDPKLAWALKNRDRFPVDVNRADSEMLLRVPGFGTRAVNRILSTRRYRTLRLDDVAKLCQSIAKVRPFVTALDWSPGASTDSAGFACEIFCRKSETSAQMEFVLMSVQVDHGLMILHPSIVSKSDTFRVTTAILCSRAVAAINASFWRFSGQAHAVSAHRLAICSEIARIWSEGKVDRQRSYHVRSMTACTRSKRSF